MTDKSTMKAQTTVGLIPLGTRVVLKAHKKASSIIRPEKDKVEGTEYTSIEIVAFGDKCAELGITLGDHVLLNEQWIEAGGVFAIKLPWIDTEDKFDILETEVAAIRGIIPKELTGYGDRESEGNKSDIQS
jgi:hypothetical protein